MTIHLFITILIIIIILIPSSTLSSTTPQTPDEARKFGVLEKDIKTKSKWVKTTCPSSNSDFFGRFRDYEEIVQYLQNEFKPIAEISTIGQSVEGRDIVAVEFKFRQTTTSKNNKPNNIPTILAIAGTHGREWTSIMGLVFAMDQFRQSLSSIIIPPTVASNNQNPVLKVIFIPIINPDGFVRTFTDGTHDKEKYSKGSIETESNIPNRYYRKNGGNVDLNRNFGPAKVVWGIDNSTKSLKLLKSDVYQGKKPFSEPETRALKLLTDKIKDDLVGFIDFHCCIGAILGPPIFGLSDSSKSVKENERVGLALINALNKAGKDVVTFLKGDGEPGKYVWRKREKSDKASGTSSSWAFNELVLDTSYVVELRGKFVAPCYEIKPIGKEVWYAMKAFLDLVPKIATTAESRKQARLVQQQQLLSSTYVLSKDDSQYFFTSKLSNNIHWMMFFIMCIVLVVVLKDRKKQKLICIVWRQKICNLTNSSVGNSNITDHNNKLNDKV
jgi:hypothetical protein